MVATVTTRAKAPTAIRTPPSLEQTTFFLRWGTLVACGIVVLAALAVYYDSFSGPFIFDDIASIERNPSLHHFGSALTPPPDAGTGGRPLLNLTFALNYTLGGTNVWGYHAFNFLVHTLAGLTLFGLVRRTLLERPTSNIEHSTSKANQSPHQIRGTTFKGLGPVDALMLALAVAVLWVVHPLQTNAVTYLSQRAECLMGLFYLLTLYCFIRGAEIRHQVSGVRHQEKDFKTQNQEAALPLSSGLTPDASRLWYSASILACLLGALSKEIIATAPAMVFLYDRTFVAGSFGEAWRQRWRYYLGLASSWLLLACLMTGLNQRGVGFDQGITWRNYALTSCRSVVLYLKLAVWPHPLVFDHGTDIVRHATEVAPYALILAVLLAGTATALWRWPVIGFAGAWFFVILAPTSSVVPIFRQPMAESRMYLSLAAVIGLVVLGLNTWIGRRGLVVLAGAAVGLGWLSVARNHDYRSKFAIWHDAATKCPGNARAHYETGNALFEMPGRLSDAIAEYRAALRLKPDDAEVHSNLGNALLLMPGSLPDAIAEYQTALRLKPDDAELHYNLGNALLEIPDRLPDAIAEFEAALRIDPDSANAHNNLGMALAKIPGRLPEAISHYEEALKIDPGLTEAHDNFGNALLQQGRYAAACEQYGEALKLKPDFVEGHVSLGVSLANMGRLDEAIAQFETALQIKPDDPTARRFLEQVQNMRAQKSP